MRTRSGEPSSRRDARPADEPGAAGAEAGPRSQVTPARTLALLAAAASALFGLTTHAPGWLLAHAAGQRSVHAAGQWSVHAAGPPLAHTGGFGEPTCRECHLGPPLNDPSGSLVIAGMQETFAPGDSTWITITLSGDGMERAGFQAAFRFLEGETAGTQAGRTAPLDEHTKVTRDVVTGVEYVHHTEAGAELAEGLGQWVIQWTAPVEARAVVLHVAANSANGDDSPLADLVYAASVVSRPARGKDGG